VVTKKAVGGTDQGACDTEPRGVARCIIAKAIVKKNGYGDVYDVMDSLIF